MLREMQSIKYSCPLCTTPSITTKQCVNDKETVLQIIKEKYITYLDSNQTCSCYKDLKSCLVAIENIVLDDTSFGYDAVRILNNAYLTEFGKFHIYIDIYGNEVILIVYGIKPPFENLNIAEFLNRVKSGSIINCNATWCNGNVAELDVHKSIEMFFNNVFTINKKVHYNSLGYGYYISVIEFVPTLTKRAVH